MRAYSVDLKHMEHARTSSFYICFEDWNLAWTCQEREAATRAWHNGLHICDAAEEIGRPERELFLLWYCLLEEEELDARPGGVLGREG